MAEAFAHALGSDIVDASSAGIYPSGRISRRARRAMAEKGIPLDSRYHSKPLSSFNLDDFDLIVNLCEYGLPNTSAVVLKRHVRHSAHDDEHDFRHVREDVERLVRFLIDHFRASGEFGVGF